MEYKTLEGEEQDYSRPALHTKFIKEGKMTIEESDRLIEKLEDEEELEDEKDDKYFRFMD